MKLHFDRKEVEKLIKHSAKAKEAKNLYGELQSKPGELLLVGDEGVYLMSASTESFLTKDGTSQVVAYAKEVNPKTLKFDEWWHNKRASFGDDDGTEIIPLVLVAEMLEFGNTRTVCLDISPEAIAAQNP